MLPVGTCAVLDLLLDMACRNLICNLAILRPLPTLKSN